MGWYANQKARNEAAKARRKENGGALGELKTSLTENRVPRSGDEERGVVLLTLSGTSRGTYRVRPDGAVTYNDTVGNKERKDEVVGHIRDGWNAEYEATASGPAASQTKGGQQFGSVAYLTVVLGEYVKAHKIETLYAGSGSRVHAKARETAIRSNIQARKLAKAFVGEDD